MHTLTVSEARSNLYRLIDDCGPSRACSHYGKRNNAVLISKKTGSYSRNNGFAFPFLA